MKGFKKLLTGILAATMVFAMGITATATESTETKSSITIDSSNKTNTDSKAVITYNYYQVLKADIVSGEQIAYYVTDAKLADAVKGTGLFNVTISADGSRYNVTIKDEKTTGDAIAKALNTDAVKGAVPATAKGEFKSEGGSAYKELEPGYYLILSSLGTVAAVQTVGDVHISEKNSYPTITKDDDKDFAQMFDTTVTYTLNVNVPESVENKEITVVDHATLGLTFNKDVVATVDKAEVAKLQWSDPTVVKVTVDEAEVDRNEYTTVIPAETVAKYAGKTIVLTYTATVNENAVVRVPELNTAYLKYDEYSSAETKPVDVTTLGVRIIKVDGTTSKALTGAEFSLWDSLEGGHEIPVVKDGDVYRIAKSGETGVKIEVDEAGKATIVGLDAKSYFLQEDKAPTGYNMLDKREELVISGEFQTATHNDVQEYEIKNFTGRTLPETGGIGTTIFYIIGGILIIAGVAYFLVRRKADAQA